MYVINLDVKKGKITRWALLLIDRNAAIYFDSFPNEYIPQSFTHNIFKIPDNGSII